MLNFPRWKIAVILLTIFAGLWFAFPNFLSESQRGDLPNWMPTNTINLGLDLQGGSHLLLEVQLDSVIEERLAAIQDDVRSALRQRRIGYTGLVVEDGRVVFRLRDPAQQDEAIEAAETLAAPIQSNVLVAAESDIDVDVLDDGRIVVELTEAGILQRRQNAVEQSIEIVRRRVDELGTREPNIQRQGTDRIVVQVPGLQNPEQLKELLNTTARLTFQMVDETVSSEDITRGRVPPGTDILPFAQGGGQVAVRRRVIVSGENLTDARPSFDQNGRPNVVITFDATGGRQFGRVTSENVGRLFAIILDDEVISAPVINEPILGGTASIAGSFTVQTANDLAILLRAGALPAPLSVLEERTVGPDLGADSVAAGETAAVIGFVAVIVFILLSYGWFGLAANTALIINIIMILAGLSVLQATLTLPGIAGIVLTIGMAVDANVLVFERIREEIKAGRNPLAAIDSGYSSALSTILDANITTLIAAVILFQFGSGPVKGFAVTLAIGIMTSVFTAVTVTRFIVATVVRKRRPQTLKL